MSSVPHEALQQQLMILLGGSRRVLFSFSRSGVGDLFACRDRALELVRNEETKGIAGEDKLPPICPQRGRIKASTSPQAGIVLPGRGQFGSELVSSGHKLGTEGARSISAEPDSML
jgi:hypothetical protein